MTYNTKYPDFATAADKTDGLSVIGVFLQVWKTNLVPKLVHYDQFSTIKKLKTDGSIKTSPFQICVKYPTSFDWIIKSYLLKKV